MSQNLTGFVKNHKHKILILSVGLLIAIFLNTQLLLNPQDVPIKQDIIQKEIAKETSKEPTKSTQTESPQTNTVKQEVNKEPTKTTQTGSQQDTPKTKIIDEFTIVNTYVREDNVYYTQGLVFKDSDTIIESAGLYGQSSIQYLDAHTMKVTKSQLLNAKYFAEGCDYVKRGDEEEIYQLTWRERKILVWDAKDLSLKKELDLPTEIREGWGFGKRYLKDETGNEKLHFYITDGSAKVYIVDAETWEVKKTLHVKNRKNQFLNMLNELEFVKGKLWANMYYSNAIAVIDPETGIAETMVNFNKLAPIAQQQAKDLKMNWRQDFVFNGIAYDENKDRLIVTGKNWPLIWEVKVEGI